MDKLIDSFCKWDHFGQGVFLLLAFGITCTTLTHLFRLFVVLFRGWPECYCEEDDEEENETEG